MRYSHLKTIKTEEELLEAFRNWLKKGNETRIICKSPLNGSRYMLNESKVLSAWRDPDKDQTHGITGCYDIRIDGNVIYMTRNACYESERETFAYVRL